MLHHKFIQCFLTANVKGENSYIIHIAYKEKAYQLLKGSQVFHEIWLREKILLYSFNKEYNVISHTSLQ